MAKVISMILMVAVLMHQNGCGMAERLWEADKFACNFPIPGFGSRATRAEFAKCLWTKAGILNPDGSFDKAEIPKYLSREFGHLTDYPEILNGFNSCVDRALQGMESDSALQCIKNEEIWDMMNKH